MLTAREARPPREGDPVPFDLAVLTHEERFLRRRLVPLVHGEEVLVDLPEATVLPHGTRLVLADGRHAEIVAAEEELLEVTAPGGALARLAWHVGNRHVPAQIEAARLLVRRDHVLADMLLGLGAALRLVSEPFEPEGGAYSHGRTHGHGPEHSHPGQARDGQQHGHPHGHHHGPGDGEGPLDHIVPVAPEELARGPFAGERADG